MPVSPVRSALQPLLNVASPTMLRGKRFYIRSLRPVVNMSLIKLRADSARDFQRQFSLAVCFVSLSSSKMRSL